MQFPQMQKANAMPVRSQIVPNIQLSLPGSDAGIEEPAG
jgi:hypothetical protein